METNPEDGLTKGADRMKGPEEGAIGQFEKRDSQRRILLDQLG
jgi:hypothetical protein